MATVYRVRAVWSGFQGAPGYSNFSFSDLTTDTARNVAGAAVKEFFTGLAAFLVTGCSIQVQPEVTEWDASTGQLTGASTMTTVPLASISTATAAPYAGGSGAAITWKTGVIFNGRRVSGRTYLVPLQGCYEQEGTLSAAAITAIGSAATAFIGSAGADFAIWAKQFADPVGEDPAVQIGGAVASVSGYTLRDIASQMRSRRL